MTRFMAYQVVKSNSLFVLPAPISYSVELTYDCYHNCSGCANTWRNKKKSYLQQWKTLLDQIAPPDNRCQHAEVIRITGGEPTLHNEFFKIIKYLDTFGINHALFTCGRWKNPQQVIDLYLGCQNSVGMLISLHGHTKDMHHQFVKSDQDSFNETCSNIYMAAKSGVEVFTNTVLTCDTCQQINEIVSLSQELGAQCAVFNRFIGSSHPLHPSDDQLKQAIIQINQLNEQGIHCRIGNCIPKCFIPNSSEASNSGIEHCAISPDGWVRPDNHTKYTFGNLFNESIEKIWHSKKAAQYRTYCNELCLKCLEFSHCRGGERSEIIEYGLKQDRLMTNPIVDKKHEPIILNPTWKPVPIYRIKKGHSGYVLTRYNISIPVSSDICPLLDFIDGQHTLSEIDARLGDSAINVIGYLYKLDFIDFC